MRAVKIYESCYPQGTVEGVHVYNFDAPLRKDQFEHMRELGFPERRDEVLAALLDFERERATRDNAA